MQQREVTFQKEQRKKRHWLAFLFAGKAQIPVDLQLKEGNSVLVQHNDPEHNKQIQELSQTLNQLLQAELYEAFFNACARGYTPNDAQQKKIDTHIIELITGSKFSQIEHYLEQGFRFNNTLAYYLITHQSFQDIMTPREYAFFQPEVKDFEFLSLPLFSKSLRETIFSDSFREHLTNQWFKSFDLAIDLAKRANSETGIQNFTDDRQHEFTRLMLRHIFLPMEMFQHLYAVQNSHFKYYLRALEQWSEVKNGAVKILSYARQKRAIRQDERLALVQEVRDSIEEKTLFLKSLNQAFFQHNMSAILDKTQALHLDKNIERAMSEQTLEVSQNINLSLLPIEAKQIIDRIRSQYEKLKQSGIENPELERLVHIQTPKIITKYLLIDEEYRDSLHNDLGQTPKEIMLETLNNIVQKFENLMLELQEERLHDLNALKRYSQKI